MGTRIGVLGIGGVGGYFGGLLAAKYFDSSDIEIIFISRLETEKIINENGLKIITPEKEQVVFPDVVSNSTEEIGELDVLIVAVKSYDLLESISGISKSIERETIILPLLNGVDAKGKIEKLFPENLVLDGCVFVISKILERGVIKRIAGKGALFFGSNEKDKRLEQLHQIFLGAGINAKYSPNILEVVWGKFMFISSLASLTSYLSVTTGQIFEDEQYEETLLKLLKEFKSVADANSIILSESIVEDTLAKMKALPYETTTSMQRDFQQKRKTEYHSLTKYMVVLASQFDVKVPTFELILAKFERKESSLQ